MFGEQQLVIQQFAVSRKSLKVGSQQIQTDPNRDSLES